jgi:amino acid permease
LLLIVVAGLTEISTILTLKLQQKVSAKGFDELAEKLLGKIGSVALSIFSMLFCLSCMVAYLVIGSDSIMSLLRLAGIFIKPGIQRILVVLATSCLIPIPLTFPRKIHILTYLSWAVFLAIIFYFVMMIVKSFIIFPKIGISKTVSFAKFDFGFFQALSVFGLPFALPVVVLPIISTYNPNLKKRTSATFVAMLFTLISVSVPGVLGYLMFGDDSKDNVLLSFPDKDVIAIMCRIGFFIVVNFSYPCMAQSILCSWSQLLFNINSHSELPFLKRGIVLFCTNIIPLLISMFLPNAGPALSIGGAMGGCLADFTFPAVMWVVYSKNNWHSVSVIACILLALFGVVSACISTYLAVLDAISAIKF